MRNVILVSVAIMAASFASCSQSNSTKGEENVPCDSINKVDSVSEFDTTDVAENKLTAPDFDIDSSSLDSIDYIAFIPRPPRKYNDAAIFGLRGHVKKCVTTNSNYSDSTTKRFRRNGSWITDFRGYKVTRDKNNQLISLTKKEVTIEPWGDNNRVTCEYNCSQTFTWKNGLLTASETVEERNNPLGLHFTYYSYYYEYDKNGLVRQEIYSDGRTYAEAYTYKYLEFDSVGNWVKREVETVSNSYKPLGTHIETRKITYY